MDDYSDRKCYIQSRIAMPYHAVIGAHVDAKSMDGWGWMAHDSAGDRDPECGCVECDTFVCICRMTRGPIRRKPMRHRKPYCTRTQPDGGNTFFQHYRVSTTKKGAAGER